MSITQDPTGLILDTTPAPKPTPKPKPTKPISTPGGIPAAPALALGAATTTAAIGALGAATGGVGVAVLAGAGAVAAGTSAARRLRSSRMGKMTTTRTITKTSGATGRKTLGGLGGGKGRGGSSGGRGKGLLGRAGGRSGSGGRAGSRGGGIASKARQAAAARKARPSSPTERRTQQTATRRARVDAARARRTQAANAKRVAAARKSTGAGMGAGMKSGRKSGSLLGGRKSPHARMSAAHKRNQRTNGQAAKSAARRQQRRAAADARRTRRVADARHRDRLRSQTSAPGKKAAAAAKRAARRRRAALWAATGTASARLVRGGKMTGRGIRETWADTMTHVLGGAQLLNALEQARVFNDAHGIGQIPAVPDTLVHTSTPLTSTGPRQEINPMSNPFNLAPEAEDMLAKIQRAEIGGMLGVVYAFDNLGPAVKTMSDSYIVLANRAAAEMPLHPEVGAALERVHRAFAQAIHAAEEVGPLTRKLHEHDINRLENQRQNEQAWDVTAQE